MKRLYGQPLSVDEAHKLGLDPGLFSIKKSTIPNIGQDLVLGLVMFEGSIPESTLNPAAHHFAHYPDQTADIGILWWISMRSFETNNKRIKGLVRNTKNPCASLAQNIGRDIASRWMDSMEDTVPKKRPSLSFSGKPKFYR